MVHPDSNGIPRVPPYLGTRPRKTLPFRLRGYHPLWPTFQNSSTKTMFFDFPAALCLYHVLSRNSHCTTHTGLTCSEFRLFPFRSPLLRKSRLLSLPGGTEMFQFPPLAPSRLCVQRVVVHLTVNRVAPFGDLRLSGCLHLPGAYRSLPRPSSPSRAKASTVCP